MERDMAKRKQITKRTRFRVFKRDGFTCGYCGRTPPAAILEIDHIEPVASGGKDTPDNLITACFDCNRGKGAELLAHVPESIGDRARRIAEGEEQLKAYKKIIRARTKRENADILSIEDVVREQFDASFNAAFRESIRSNFLPRFDASDLRAFMYHACAKTGHPSRAMRYFCGICWKKIRASGS